MAAGSVVKDEGKPNDLIERIKGDERFGLTEAEIDECLNAKDFIGRAPSQVDEFLSEYIYPILENNPDAKGLTSDLNV